MSNATSERPEGASGARVSSAPMGGSSKALPWGPVSAVLVALITFIVSQFLAVILASFGAQALGLPGGQDLFDTTGGQFAFVLISEGLVLATLWVFLRRRHGHIRQLGLARTPAWRDAGYA